MVWQRMGMNAETADFWDGQAQTFDDEPDHGLRDPGVRAAWARLLQPEIPPAPASVADLGSGTGSLSCLLAEAGHDVRGVDLAPRMVQAARAKATAAGLRAAFEVGDADNPDLPDGVFDVVLVRHVLWALPDPDAAVARWVRLLRDDGRLLIVEGRWNTGGGLTAQEAETIVRRHRQHVQVRELSDEELWGAPIHDERFLLASHS